MHHEENKKDAFKDKLSFKQKEWAERTPGSSTFGAPVFFQNKRLTSDQTKTISPTETVKPHKSIKSTHAPSQAQKLKQMPQRRAAAEPQSSPDNKNERAQETKSWVHAVQQDKKLSAKLQAHPELSQAQKKVTLADIARGFLAQQGTGSDSGLRTKGAKKQPPDEQIKYERYAQKIHWSVQNSFNIHRRKLLLSRAVHATIKVYLELQQTGLLNRARLVRASGVPELDEFILFLFKDAGKSFPPPPKFLGKKAQSMDYTIRIDTGPVSGSSLAMTLM